MKKTIGFNHLDNHLSDEQIQSIFNDITNVDYPNIPVDLDISISVKSLSTMPSGYGHWKVTVDLDINGEHLELTRITTDSTAIDAKNDYDNNERQSEGYYSLLSECITKNEDAIFQFIEQLTEQI